MELVDYDGDGRATEFLLQVDVFPCGKRSMALVGISKSRPTLHAFGTAEHPERPLLLFPRHWEELRRATEPTRSEYWPCGDHGSLVENELVLSRDATGFHAVHEIYSCDRTELLERKPL